MKKPAQVKVFASYLRQLESNQKRDQEEIGRLRHERDELEAAVNVERRAFKTLLLKHESAVREMWTAKEEAKLEHARKTAGFGPY